MSGGLGGDPGLAPGGFTPPQTIPGLGFGPSATAALQTLQSVEQTLNAILTQLKNGIALATTLPTFMFANLPSAASSQGVLVFVPNARKPGQGPGAGTGMTAFSDGVGWFSTAGTALAV